MLTLTDKLFIWLLTGPLAICTIFFNMYLLLVIQRSYRKKHKLNPCDFTSWQTIDEIDVLCKTHLMEASLLVLIFSLKLIIFWSTAFLTFYYGTKLVVEPEMKASSNGAHGPKLGTQMRVIRMTLSLVVVFVCFVVVDVFTQVTVVLMKRNTMTLTILFASIYTAVSAAVMVYGKKSHWKELVASYNIFLDEYPCLSGLKVSEVKTEPHDNENH
ncbi:hypothetical protein E1301_Tti016616 [Triplophysa tibetana]|uniref:Uncharacterized protein n=1 Tax=Triplophysa tibetana TaxID=1572043 RepID=A0A5A9NXQ9_9TELE|nr:hypothetical protein E1301_Tti016616 [Triplophysa tibetana]